jgi:fused signal recognition particle receptor
MSRRWLVYLPLALTVAGVVALPTAASAAGHDSTPPAPACAKDSTQVTDLTTVVTNLGTELAAAKPDPTKISQIAGDLFKAVTAAQDAGCLPALPSTPPAPTPPPAAAPQAAPDAAKCTADTMKLLSAALDQISAGTATTPDPAALLKAATGVVTAITSINTDTCLPVSLPVPTVPTPPVPPTPPVG